MAFKESEKLELKKSTSELKEAIISVSSILNKHQKGELYFGIKNDGTIVGQNVSEQTILENLFLKKKKVSWEEGASEKTIRDVNEDAVKNFVTKANKANRINFTFSDVESILNKLNLIKDDMLLRAVDVLFCDNNSLEVQAAVFAGVDKLTFLDIKQFKGNIFNLLEQSESYIKEHMNWRAKFVGRERVEIPEVPVRAITEAIVNSLCHRDYNNPKGNEIAIFKDRIEIYNPGQFPEEYSPFDFIKGEERSILRNPLIAHTLYLSKEIERWGSGIRRIYEECEKQNVKVEFKKLKSGFVVVFYRMEKVGEEVVRNGGQN
ncbi:MAG: ATP-binding protein [Candidatus Methanoperedens sp.]